MEIENIQSSKCFKIINVYAHVDNKERRYCWESIVALKNKINYEIILMAGNLNIAMMENEKMGRT